MKGNVFNTKLKEIMIHSKSYTDKANAIIAQELGSNLSVFGHRVTVISISTNVSESISTDKIRSNLNFIQLPHYTDDLSLSGFIKRGFLLTKIYKNFKPDFIVSLDPILPETFLPLLIGYARRIPTLVYFTDNWGIDPDRGRKLIEQIIEEFLIVCSLKLGSAHIYSSELVKNRLKKYSKKQGEIIPQGFNYDEFSDIKSPQVDKIKREKPGIREQNKIILTSFDFREIETYIKLAKSFELNNYKFTLHVINDTSNLSSLREVDYLLRKGYLIISNRLERDRYIRAVLESDVLWISGPDSFWDRARFPTRLPEYMASGNPIVSSIRGTTESFLSQNGYAAIANFAFPNHDVSSLLESFNFMTSSDFLVAESTKKAKNYAYKNLKWVKIAANLNDILDLIDSKE